MKRIILAILAACVVITVRADEPPRLYVVSARDTVYPGQLFSVTVTAFGVTEPIAFDAGGLQVVSQEQAGQTLYVTMRAEGEARDVRVKAWAGGVEDSKIIRVCCVRAPDAVNPARLMYFPVFRH